MAAGRVLDAIDHSVPPHITALLRTLSVAVAERHREKNAPADLARNPTRGVPTGSCGAVELRWRLASFRGMTDFVFETPLRLAREITVRTLDDAADFARTYVGPRLPRRRDRLVRRLEEISDDASARIAARAFRTWAIAEGLLAEETWRRLSESDVVDGARSPASRVP
jgi:hypothetical protein